MRIFQRAPDYFEEDDEDAEEKLSMSELVYAVFYLIYLFALNLVDAFKSVLSFLHLRRKSL